MACRHRITRLFWHFTPHRESPRVPNKTSISRIFPILMTIAVAAPILTACSIKSALPELDYELSDRARSADWPRLVDRREFSKEYSRGQNLAPEDEIEGLQARVKALQTRAKALQRPVISAQDKLRLRRAITS